MIFCRKEKQVYMNEKRLKKNTVKRKQQEIIEQIRRDLGACEETEHLIDWIMDMWSTMDLVIGRFGVARALQIISAASPRVCRMIPFARQKRARRQWLFSYRPVGVLSQGSGAQPTNDGERSRQAHMSDEEASILARDDAVPRRVCRNLARGENAGRWWEPDGQSADKASGNTGAWVYLDVIHRGTPTGEVGKQVRREPKHP